MLVNDKPIFYVYGLTDSLHPTDIRYVGVSVSPYARLKSHLQEARSGVDTYKNRWIRSTISEGREIVSHVLYEFNDRDSAYSYEKVLISNMKQSGHKLTNTHEGGVGGWEIIGPIGREIG